MDNEYRVVIIVPSGYRHSLCFTEIAFLLKNSIISCGYTCDMTINELATDRINIILGYHLLAPNSGLAQFRCIPYQLEQLGAGNSVFSEVAKRTLLQALSVWDYSPENIAFLRNQGIQAKHLPIGFHETLQQLPHNTLKDIDILFYGSMGDRRKAIITQLQANKSINVQTIFGVYGKERDALIARSKIILNVHYYPAQIFEAVRISYLLNNRCCVVSEESLVYPYQGVNLVMVPYERIVDTCTEILGEEKTPSFIANRNFEEFKMYFAMEKFIAPLLGAEF